LSKPSFEHPVDHVVWKNAADLKANDYNPNVVYSPELRLLERSMLSQGWVQPILIDQADVIIDGFHRVYLARTSKRLKELTAGKVPCAILTLSEPERMMLTVRINRAKGSHIAIKMHELVAKLITEYGMPAEYIAESIGATKDEVQLLSQENVFKAMKTEAHQYSRAWVPK